MQRICRFLRRIIKMMQGGLPAHQGQNPVLAVLCVPNLLDRGSMGLARSENEEMERMARFADTFDAAVDPSPASIVCAPLSYQLCVPLFRINCFPLSLQPQSHLHCAPHMTRGIGPHEASKMERMARFADTFDAAVPMLPLSIELGTPETVRTGFWPGRSSKIFCID